jgi:hypothetical protein
MTPYPIYPQPDESRSAYALWSPASTPNSHFPLQVSVVLNTNHYNGYNFVGDGTIQLLGDTPQVLQVHYRGGLTFDAEEYVHYQARWITPGKKLAILMQKPESSRTAACRAPHRSRSSSSLTLDATTGLS